MQARTRRDQCHQLIDHYFSKYDSDAVTTGAHWQIGTGYAATVAWNDRKTIFISLVIITTPVKDNCARGYIRLDDRLREVARASSIALEAITSPH